MKICNKGEISYEKNKIDVVRAVCNSAAKKLTSLFLISVIGGLAFVGDKGKFWASAQEQVADQVERDHLLAEILQINERRLQLGHFANEGNFNMLMAQATRIIQSQDIPLDEAERLINEDIAPWITNLENAQRRQIPARDRRGGILNLLNPLNWFNALGRSLAALVEALGNWVNNLLPAQRPNELRRDNNNAIDGIQRGDHITAVANSHVHSFSANELIHEGEGLALIPGPGAVDVDAGDVIISECNEYLSRDVTVNQANSLTVAPGISTRTQNGTEFTMGETLQETAENILRALSPNSLLNIINRFGSSGGSQ